MQVIPGKICISRSMLLFYQRIIRMKRRRSAAGSKGRRKASETLHRLFTCTLYMCKEKISTEEQEIIKLILQNIYFLNGQPAKKQPNHLSWWTFPHRSTGEESREPVVLWTKKKIHWRELQKLKPQPHLLLEKTQTDHPKLCNRSPPPAFCPKCNRTSSFKTSICSLCAR